MTGPVLQFVPLDKVREFWPRIRDAVAEIAALDERRWLPEDVFHELRSGGTYLFTTEDVRGFIVTQILVNPYSRSLHVWLAHNVGGDWTPAFFDQLKDIAASNDCGSITFASERTGWKRAIPGIRATTHYSFDLGD